MFKSFAFAVFFLVFSASAQASEPLSHKTISEIEEVLGTCSGGYRSFRSGKQRDVKPTTLQSLLPLLSEPSRGLSKDEAGDLYKVGKALLIDAIDDKSGIFDPSAFIQCPPIPRLGEALLTYLIGNDPLELKGPTNSFAWLARTYETGVVGQPDAQKARVLYLRYAMHSIYIDTKNWSDGIDDDLLANIERAGFRPYLEELASADAQHGSAAARIILADEAIQNGELGKARKLLVEPSSPGSTKRLFDLEQEGVFDVVASAKDIAFWANSRYRLGHFDEWAQRMFKGVKLYNGGPITTNSRKPTPDELRPFLNTEAIEKTSATRGHSPARALVDPSGKAIYVEACKATPDRQNHTLVNNWVLRDISLLYDKRTMPNLPITKKNGREVYGWVVLPAVQFVKDLDGVTTVELRETTAGECLHPNDPAPISPPRSSPTPK